MCAGGGSGLWPPRTPRAGVHDACVSCQAAQRSELGYSLSIGLCRHKASEPLYKAGGHPQGLDRCEAHKVCSTRALGVVWRCRDIRGSACVRAPCETHPRAHTTLCGPDCLHGSAIVEMSHVCVRACGCVGVGDGLWEAGRRYPVHVL